MTFRLHNLIREDQTLRLQGLLFLRPVRGHVFHVSRFHPWLHSDERQLPHGTISVGAIHLSEHRDGKKQQRAYQQTDEYSLRFHGMDLSVEVFGNSAECMKARVLRQQLSGAMQ